MYNTTSANISAMWKNHWGNTQGSTARIENMTRSYHFMKPGPRARLEMRIGESATFKRKKKKKKYIRDGFVDAGNARRRTCAHQNHGHKSGLERFEPGTNIWTPVNRDQETVLPPQSGILRPGFNLRAGSIRPHLSSHSCPGVLYMTFHGSSNASNL